MVKYTQNNEVYLLRCVITKEYKDSFLGIDYNKRKYIITKNYLTKNYKIGTDVNFYATKEVKGYIFKKTVVNTISNKEYEEILAINYNLDKNEVHQTIA